MLYLFLLIFMYLPVLSYTDNYTVQKNDSLWKIANNSQIPLFDIRKLNELYDDQVLYGQKLYVPTEIKKYTVKAGDSFKSISSMFNTPLRYIITLNNISKSYVIEGQTLRIPVTTTTSIKNTIKKNTIAKINTAKIKVKSITYKVRRGDTLSDVALKYKTSVPKLRELNNKTANSTIYIGETLIVGNKEIPNSPAKPKIIHQVKRGETLGQIAIDYRVSLSEVRSWNSKKNSSIYIGEKLIIYSEKPKVIPKPIIKNYKTLKYTVKRGENLSLIAAKFGTTPNTIKQWNKKKSDKLFIGEILSINVKSTRDLEHSTVDRTENTKLIRYRVKRGDTLDQIAINHNVRRSQLLSWNNKRNTRIYIGERIKIYVPNRVTIKAPTKSKKAQYIIRKSTSGIKSNKFKNIPLPIKLSQVIKATSSGRGINISLKIKAPIHSPSKASIQYAGYINALQNVVILQLSGNRNIIYTGLENLQVKTGQKIAKGDVLGIVGDNKLDKTPNFYMEIRENNKVADILYSYKELTRKQ